MATLTCNFLNVAHSGLGDTATLSVADPRMAHDGTAVILPEEVSAPVDESGTAVFTDVDPGPVVVTLRRRLRPASVFPVVVPDEPEVTLADLLEGRYPYTPAQISAAQAAAAVAKDMADSAQGSATAAAADADRAEVAAAGVDQAVSDAAGVLAGEIADDLAAAQSAKSGAESARDQAVGAASTASTKAGEAAASAATADSRATDAEGAVASIAAHATDAEDAAGRAAVSESNAAGSATAAAGHADRAEVAADAADASATAAGVSATAAAGDATTAVVARDSAVSSADSAQGSAAAAAADADRAEAAAERAEASGGGIIVVSSEEEAAALPIGTVYVIAAEVAPGEPDTPEPAPVTIVGTTGENITTDTFTPTIPSATTGDTIIIAANTKAVGGSTLTAPAGFTTLVDGYWKGTQRSWVLTGPWSDDLTITADQPLEFGYAAVAVRGAASVTSGMVKDREMEPAESTTITAPAVDHGTNDLAIGIAFERTSATETSEQVTVSEGWTIEHYTAQGENFQTTLIGVGGTGDMVVTYPNAQATNGVGVQVVAHA